MSRHTYQVSWRERVQTPAGEFDAVKVTRKSDGRTRSAELWLAADRTAIFRCASLLVDKDGTRYEHLARRIRREGQPPRCSRTPAALHHGAARERARRSAAVALFPRAPRSRPEGPGFRRRVAYSRCCVAGARSKRRRARRAGARWSPRRLLRVLGFSARRLQGWSTTTLLARRARGRERDAAARGARRPAGLALGAAGRAAGRERGAAHRAGAAQSRAARPAGQSCAHRARGGAGAAGTPMASSATATPHSPAGLRLARQAGDQPPRAVSRGPGRSAGRGQPGARLAAGAAPRRDDRRLLRWRRRQDARRSPC